MDYKKSIIRLAISLFLSPIIVYLISMKKTQNTFLSLLLFVEDKKWINPNFYNQFFYCFYRF